MKNDNATIQNQINYIFNRLEPNFDRLFKFCREQEELNKMLKEKIDRLEGKIDKIKRNQAQDPLRYVIENQNPVVYEIK